MIIRTKYLCCTAAVVLCHAVLTSTSQASFHFWEVVEVYSSPDGTIQFVEMMNSNSANQIQANPSFGFTSNANTLDPFPDNLPGGIPTNNAKFLMGTPSYSALALNDANVPAPDFLFPTDNFFSTSGDKLSLVQASVFEIDSLTFTSGQLPTDGVNSLVHAFGDDTNASTTLLNSPTNFFGETGSVTLPSFDPADFNQDGFVDGVDLGVLLGNWLSSFPTPPEAELSGTAPVDGIDLGILLGVWNPSPLSAATSVPEPGSVVLLSLVGMALACHRRR